MKVLMLDSKSKKFQTVEDRDVNPDEADGYDSLLMWIFYKVTTKGITLVFPYAGIFPTETLKQKLKIKVLNSGPIPDEILNDKKLVFWPTELCECSFGRPQDIVIGKKSISPVSYIVEVVKYLEARYPLSYMDFIFYLLVTDIHYRRVLRDLGFILSSSNLKNRRLLVVPNIVKVKFPIFSRIWWLKIVFRLRELVILLGSFLFWNLYFEKALEKGGLK